MKYRFVVKKQLEFWEIQYHSELDEKTFSLGDIKETVRYKNVDAISLNKK